VIKCIIVEDEALAQDVIQSHLQKVDRFELVGICNNALEAKELLDKKEVDLMFLDIQLPGMTGLHFLRTLPNPPLVVVTTAYSEYAIESYEFNIIDYLLKPISFERFLKTVDKIVHGRLFTTPPVKEKDDPPGDHIFVKSNSKFFKVNFSEIVYIESMKDYIKVFTKQTVIITKQSISSVEAMLPEKDFIRVHRSYIVSLQKIKSFTSELMEIEKTEIPIGKLYRNEVMKVLN